MIANIEQISLDIGNRMKMKRESLGLSIFDVARRLSVKSETIKGIESGKGQIKNYIGYASLLGEIDVLNISKSSVPASITYEELFRVLNELRERNTYTIVN